MSSASASAFSGLCDVDLGLDDRHQAGGQDLPADLELLVDDGLDARRVGQLDDRAHLGAEHALGHAAASSSSSSGIGFMTCAPSTSSARPLSTFRNGTTCLRCQRYSPVSMPSIWRSMVISKRIAPRTRSPVKLGLVDDAAAHLVDLVEHLRLAVVLVLLDAVQLQRLRGAAAALVEGGDEAVPGADLLELLLVHWCVVPMCVFRR